ncbi:MAG: DNA primase [Rickettsiaceae bacterium]|nr:DNA primase [Rickettsiaceae bacterium]
MKYSFSNFYEKIRDNISVSDVAREYISLTKRGHEYSAICPFHTEKSPSFTINDQKKFYHCFGCGAHGDVIKFESEQTGLEYRDSALKIAERFGIEVPKFSKEEKQSQLLSDKISASMKEASKFFASNMNEKITSILLGRGISKDAIIQYNLGYTGEHGDLLKYFSKKNVRLEDLLESGLVVKKGDGKYYEFFHNRIIIPVVSNFGKVIAFGGRSIGSEMPKYVNSPETQVFKKGESLFGEDIAYSCAHKTGSVILSEGYFDVIAIHQAGFRNAVASLGTAVTESQLIKLWKIAEEIIICFDGDAAGQRATKKIVDLALPFVRGSKKLSFILLPSELDPDDFIKKYGRDNFKRLLDDRMSLSDFIFFMLSKDIKLETAEDRATFEQNLDSYSSKINDNILRNNIKKYFKSKCWELYNKKTKQTSTTLLQAKNDKLHSEIDNIDDLIIGLIINNLNNIEYSKIKDTLEFLCPISSKSEIIDYILEYFSHNNSEPILIDKKKTSFYEEFEIISSKYIKSTQGTSHYNNHTEVLDYLLSKRYLYTLNQEFKSIMNNNSTNIDERIEFYLEEIKTTKDKIRQQDAKFALKDN